MPYTFLQTAYLFLSIACLLAIASGLKWALNRSMTDEKKRKRAFRRVLLAVSGWLLLISAISFTDFLQDFEALPPRMFLFLWTPPLVLIWLLNTKSIGQLLRVLPPQWLIYIQVFRVPVELMLWGQFLLGLTPVQMTLEGQNLDILAGLSAPLIGLLIARKSKHSLTAALLWNIFCLGLLINIVAVAILSFPSPFRIFMNEPANTLITEFPFIFLPLVLVPIAYYGHALSIKQLLMLRRAARKKQTAVV